MITAGRSSTTSPKIEYDVSERGIYLGEFNPTTAPKTVGSRRAAIQEFGMAEIMIRVGYTRSAKSRSHSRSKERRANSR